MTSEHALLERAKRYDQAALGELYDRYAPRIYAYIYRRVGNASLAEDLTGDVFVRMMQAIQSERSWRVSFHAWLYRIAHNLVVDYYRRQPAGPFVPLDEVSLSSDRGNPVHTAEESISRERLRSAVGRLTAEQQAVLTLRFGEGMTARKAAYVLQKTTGAVEALQRRALAALRRALEDEASDEGET